MPMSRVKRFKDAQEGVSGGVSFDDALREIQTGGKRSHWIWYVFPQIAGLGSSGYAVRYAIEDVDEAIEYLRDETLRARLVTITRAVAEQIRPPRSLPLTRVMGSSIDTQKLVSSLTLFGQVALDLHARETLAEYAELASLAREVLSVAAAQGYPACQHTLTRLRR
jgi:uncharacterized protein (DUF1810 family)